MKRDQLRSRLGFILLSAGCAIGIGNVWKFPYMTGKYGGAAFILIYLGFLVLLGLPILVSEFAVGRSSRLSTARAFHKLEPEGSNFHKYSYMGMIGNYMLMMFYTMVAGWMLYYAFLYGSGKITAVSAEETSGFFSRMLVRLCCLSPCPTCSIIWWADASGAAVSSCSCLLRRFPPSLPCLKTSSP